MSEWEKSDVRVCAYVCVCVFASAHVWLFLLQIQYKNTHSTSSLLAGSHNFKGLLKG